MENIGIKKMAEELKKLNPSTTFLFKEEGWTAIILAQCSDCSKLTFPEGYYLSGKNGLTNKHNTASGQYECFELMTMFDYLAGLV